MLERILKAASARPFNAFEEELPARMAVFGTGERGRRCRLRLEKLGVSVPCFLDNNPARQGTVVDGLHVLPPADFLAATPDVPVLLASFAHQTLFDQLVSLGCLAVYRDCLAASPPLSMLTQRRIGFEAVLEKLTDGPSRDTYARVLRMRFFGVPLPALSPYPIYAHPEVLARPGDVVIDAGAASGDTLQLFHAQSGGDASIHCFEPTPSAFAELEGLVRRAGLPGIHPVRAALWDRNGHEEFFEAYAMSHGNRIGGQGGVLVETVTLDSYVESRGLERVDLIKLDVEGAELAVLRGAADTIRRFKPRLQVCLYHEYDDLWEIPAFLKELVPGYRMFFGHHSPGHLDSVLYCVEGGS